MNFLAVVLVQFLLFIGTHGPQRLRDVAIRVLAADHEADLAGWVGRNGGVGVFGDGKDFSARLLERGDQGEMKPYVLG